jgi:hypothetical protein
MRLKNILSNPAKTHGNPEYLGTTDQRGYTRSDTVSIGAYQWVWPSQITITPNQAVMQPGDSLALSVSVMPEWVNDSSWLLASTDTGIICVSNSMIHAVAEGQALLVACTREGNRRDTCLVSVLNDTINVTGTIQTSQDDCFDALSMIRVAGNGNTFVVQPGGAVTLIAGQKIQLLEGTNVNEYGYLNARITATGEYCHQLMQPMVQAKEVIENQKWPVKTDNGTSEWKVRAYPNPTSGDIHLGFINTANPEPVQITVYNLFGEKLFSAKITGQSEYLVSMESLQPGIYLLMISQGIRRELVKIIRN